MAFGGSVSPPRRKRHCATWSTLQNSGRTLRKGCHRSKNIASGPLVSHHPEGRPTVLPRVRPMPVVGIAFRAHSDDASTHPTLRAFPKMGPQLHWPIQPNGNTHRESVHFGSNRVLQPVCGSEGLKRQYNGLYGKIPIWEHLAPIQLSNRVDQQPRGHFINKVVQGLTYHYVVVYKKSTPYYIQTHGLAESTNKIL